MAQLGSAERVFRRVQILDLTADAVLNFNTYLYLPANRKHVKFSSAGDSLDQARVDRLKRHAVGALAIPVEEMKEFYSYTAQSLKKLNQGTGLSETERKERLESTTRELITSLFDDAATSTEAGKTTVADMQNVIKSYITDSGTKGDGWYNRFLAATASGAGSYSRAATISTYAALFAIGLGIQEVEDVALAALLHDLGMSTVPEVVVNTPPQQWLQADRDIYEAHPEATVRIIRERKLVVSELVYKFILQHHEKFNGTGFPKKLSGDRIAVGAQLIGIAEALYESTVPREGQTTTPARAVLEQLARQAAENPTLASFQPDLLKKICRLFAA
jgi:response regulator RpfG family c-di-GMP phosphodiesterase